MQAVGHLPNGWGQPEGSGHGGQHEVSRSRTPPLTGPVVPIARPIGPLPNISFVCPPPSCIVESSAGTDALVAAEFAAELEIVVAERALARSAEKHRLLEHPREGQAPGGPSIEWASTTSKRSSRSGTFTSRTLTCLGFRATRR